VNWRALDGVAMQLVLSVVDQDRSCVLRKIPGLV